MLSTKALPTTITFGNALSSLKINVNKQNLKKKKTDEEKLCAVNCFFNKVLFGSKCDENLFIRVILNKHLNGENEILVILL